MKSLNLQQLTAKLAHGPLTLEEFIGMSNEYQNDYLKEIDPANAGYTDEELAALRFAEATDPDYCSL